MHSWHCALAGSCRGVCPPPFCARRYPCLPAPSLPAPACPPTRPPYLDRYSDVTRPVGPAPHTSTGTSTCRARLSAPLPLLLMQRAACARHVAAAAAMLVRGCRLQATAERCWRCLLLPGDSTKTRPPRARPPDDVAAPVARPPNTPALQASHAPPWHPDAMHACSAAGIIRWHTGRPRAEGFLRPLGCCCYCHCPCVLHGNDARRLRKRVPALRVRIIYDLTPAGPLAVAIDACLRSVRRAVGRRHVDGGGSGARQIMLRHVQPGMTPPICGGDVVFGSCMHVAPMWRCQLATLHTLALNI